MAADEAEAICIDSDGDGEDAPPVRVSKELVCKLLVLPDGAGVKARDGAPWPSKVSADGGQAALHAVEGTVTIRLHGGCLEFCRGSGLPGDTIRLQSALIAGVEELADEWTLLLRFRTEVALQQLGLSRAGVLGLRPLAAAAECALATLRWWLPDVPVKGKSVVPARREAATSGTTPLRWDGIELTARDVDLLGEGRCVNDAVVDFFLKLVIEVMAPPRLRERALLTSTFFFQKLTSGGVVSGDEGWNNVRKWHGHLQGGLLSQDYIFVPVNEQNVHWWLIVVCFPHRALPGSLEPGLPSGKRPRIVFLDSAQEAPPKNRTLAFLRGYLWREWRERFPAAATSGDDCEKITRLLEIAAVEGDVPKQTNGYDCGIFVIEYLLTLCRSAVALDGLGLANHRHWFGQHCVTRSRKRLRKIAEGLRRHATKKCEPDVGRLLQDEALRAKVRQAFSGAPKAQRPQARGHAPVVRRRHGQDGRARPSKRTTPDAEIPGPEVFPAKVHRT